VLPLAAASTVRATTSYPPTPAQPDCSREFGVNEYWQLIDLLQKSTLASVNENTPVSVDAGTGELRLIVAGRSVTHVFEGSDNIRSGEVIKDGEALESKLNYYKSLGCPTPH
jgi:hypothetical protein